MAGYNINSTVSFTSFTTAGPEVPSILRKGSTKSPSALARFVRGTPDSNDQATIITVEREVEGFLLPHETPGDMDDDSEHKPIRYIRYFRIIRLPDPDKFELGEKENYISLIYFEEGCESGPLYIFGFARIKSGDEFESDDRTERTVVNEEVPLLSSVIMRSWWSRDPSTSDPWVFLMSVVEIELIWCSGIWLETQYAYYVLEDPHPDYQEHYTKFNSWVQITHRLVNLARATPDITLDEILKQISVQEHEGSDDHLAENELRDTVSPLHNC
jgi:Cytosine specific DNA methyltransferase replication foci domain